MGIATTTVEKHFIYTVSLFALSLDY